jgi:uncharacterized protein (DUF2164 family)
MIRKLAAIYALLFINKTIGNHYFKETLHLTDIN